MGSTFQSGTAGLGEDHSFGWKLLLAMMYHGRVGRYFSPFSLSNCEGCCQQGFFISTCHTDEERSREFRFATRHEMISGRTLFLDRAAGLMKTYSHDHLLWRFGGLLVEEQSNRIFMPNFAFSRQYEMDFHDQQEAEN